ncbi:hypothetical protein ACKKBG_A15895 [Auxenochlorella protothecoides x Auxenochlorella symbiontica]
MERPTGSSHLSYTMAGLTALGGVMGFARTASTPSLVAGVAIGGLFAYGGYLIQIGRSDRGHQVSLAASLVLLGAMGPRYLRTRKAMPAGVMSVAAIASAVYQGRKTWEWL